MKTQLFFNWALLKFPDCNITQNRSHSLLEAVLGKKLKFCTLSIPCDCLIKSRHIYKDILYVLKIERKKDQIAGYVIQSINSGDVVVSKGVLKEKLIFEIR